MTILWRQKTDTQFTVCWKALTHSLSQQCYRSSVTSAESIEAAIRKEQERHFSHR